MLNLITSPDHVNRSLMKLLIRAQMSDKEAQRIAHLLLAFYNGSRWPVDLEDLLYLPRELMDHVRHVVNFFLTTGVRLNALISQHEIQPLIDKWAIAETA